jgi:hypothetical protein
MSSLIRRFKTHRLARLTYLTKYGPLFLSDRDHKKLLKRKIEGYHKFLARSIFELRDREFWNYHKNQLESLGYHISWAKLIKALFLELLNPRVTVGRIRRATKWRKNPQDMERWETVLTSMYTQEDSDWNKPG